MGEILLSDALQAATDVLGFVADWEDDGDGGQLLLLLFQIGNHSFEHCGIWGLELKSVLFI